MNLKPQFLAIFFALSSIATAQPSNNSCSEAIPLCPGIAISGTTIGATADAGTDYNFCFSPSATVWYKFTTGNTGGIVSVQFSNLVFNPDPSMGQYIEAHMISTSSVCSIPSYTPVSACGGSSTNFSITSAVALTPNTTYYVQIDGTDSGTGVTLSAQCNFDISITGDIVYQTEENFSVCYGSDYTFLDGYIETSITSDVVHDSNLGTGVGGCDSIVITYLEVQPQVSVVATQAGVTFTANSIIADYQWVDCDNGFSEIPGTTNQSYTATQNGHYACVVIENGCSDTTTCFEADFTSIPENSISFQVYPNPTDEDVVVLFDKSINGLLWIENIQGQRYQTMPLIDVSMGHIETSELPCGIYFVTIDLGQETLIRKKVLIQ